MREFIRQLPMHNHLTTQRAESIYLAMWPMMAKGISFTFLNSVRSSMRAETMHSSLSIYNDLKNLECNRQILIGLLTDLGVVRLV